MTEFSFLGAAERSRVQAAAAGTASGTFDFTFSHDATSTGAAPSSTLSEDYWHTVLGYQPGSRVVATPAHGHGAFITLRVQSLRQAQPQPQPASTSSARQARPVLSLIIPDNAAEVSAFSWSSDSDHPDAGAYSASEYGDDLDSDDLSMHDAVEYQDEDIESLWLQVQESRRPDEGTYSPWARQLLDPWTPVVYEDEHEDFGILPYHEDQSENLPTLPVYQIADEASPDLGSLPDLEYEDQDPGQADYEDEDQDEPLTPLPDYEEDQDADTHTWWQMNWAVFPGNGNLRSDTNGW